MGECNCGNNSLDFSLDSSCSDQSAQIVTWDDIKNKPSCFPACDASGAITGEIRMLAMTTVPTGWLNCDGSSVLRTDYGALFTAISTVWGSVDSTHFTLPDFRGRFLIGDGTGAGLTARVLGTYIGAESYHDIRTYPIASIAVSGSTPNMSVTGIGTMTNSSISIVNTLAVSSVTASITNPAIIISGGVLSGGITASMINPAITVTNTLTAAITNPAITVNTVVNGAGGPTIAVTYASCHQLSEGANAVTFPPCDLTVLKSNIISAFITTASIVNSSITFGGSVTAAIINSTITIGNTLAVSAVTASITNPAIIVSGGVLSGGVAASIVNPAITVSGTATGAALTGVTASGSTGTNSIFIPTIPPAAVVRFIIKT